MEKEFVTYELAVKLKVLGFDEPCLAYMFKHENYHDDIRYYPMPRRVSEGVLAVEIPTFSQAFRWFREKYHIAGVVDLDLNDVITNTCNLYNGKFMFLIHKIKEDLFYTSLAENLIFDTYEEAELACLRKLIEIVSQ